MKAYENLIKINETSERTLPLTSTTLGGGDGTQSGATPCPPRVFARFRIMGRPANIDKL